MKALFIGGTGIISSACSQLCLEHGIELVLLNRGKSNSPILGARQITADIHYPSQVKAALKNDQFDVVVNWIGFRPQDVQNDIDLFTGKTNQYIFISSASAYQKPPQSLPITEQTPLKNPFWQYSRDKIACEEILVKNYLVNRFPATIVRPSYTYAPYTIPISGGYTNIDRLRKGKTIVIPDNGQSPWVLTHHRDFAKGFLGLMGNPKTIGEAFHITSDEVLTWNQIYSLVAEAFNTTLNAIYVPSKTIATYHKDWGDSLIGDKSQPAIFDNSKLKSFVQDFKANIPFSEGVQEIAQWYADHQEHDLVDKGMDEAMDKMILDGLG